MSIRAFGTICSVTIYGNDDKNIFSKIFDRLLELDNMFNVNLDDSDLQKVNLASGKNPVFVHDEVAAVLQAALFYAQKSDGAFDPTIGPLVKLWGINTEGARVPDKEEIDKALSLVDYTKVEISGPAQGKKVFLKDEGMSLDLGGIAKGFATDEIMKIVKSENVRACVIDFGGNIYVYGQKPNKEAWKIGIKNPFYENGYPALTLSLSDSTAVITSGIYERNFSENGILYHHILDPKTGYPCDNPYGSTTIVCENAMQADALSTIAFLLGPDFYYQIFDSPAIFIGKNAGVMVSRALKNSMTVYSNFFLLKIY